MKYISFLFLILFLASCNSEVKTERIFLQPELLSDEIYTTMPGGFVTTDDYLVWTNPFSNDYFVHVHEFSGKEVGVMGKHGEGPDEFVSGGIGLFSVENKLFASDANGLTRGYLSIDSLIAGKEPLIKVFEPELDQGMENLDKDLFLRRTENGEPDYFEVSVHGKVSGFGVYPFREIKRHFASYLAYNPVSQQLAVTAHQTPYLALYKREGDTFKLQGERFPDYKNYEIENGDIIFDDKRGGISGIALSKDYIIALQRDYQTDPMDESTVGRNAAKCSHTVFLYDYQLNLVKIVDLGMPVMRIAAKGDRNTLYAIGVNPEFALVKYEL